MIVMNLRTFKIKVLVFCFIKPPFYGGRHSTTDIPYKKYTICYKQKQVFVYNLLKSC